MNKLDGFGLFIIIILLIICVYKYLDNLDTFDLKCVVSGVDGNKYCVRERKKLDDAANLLAKTTQKCKQLVEYVGQKYGNQENVKRLVDGFNPKQNM
jgi:hypothetical protein